MATVPFIAQSNKEILGIKDAIIYMDKIKDINVK
jgi:hypothetical protein